MAEGQSLEPSPKIVYLQVQWVEEEHQVLSLVVIQLDVLELPVDDSRAFNFRCLLTNSWHVEIYEYHLSVTTTVEHN